jgi:hypothetical protein
MNLRHKVLARVSEYQLIELARLRSGKLLSHLHILSRVEKFIDHPSLIELR